MIRIAARAELARACGDDELGPRTHERRDIRWHVVIDDAILATPYPIGGSDSVRFFFDRDPNDTFDPGTDDLPVFEAAGDDLADGFINNGLLQGDIPAAGFASQLGDYFLRPLQSGRASSPFIIDYDTTLAISALSGEIWDIDGGVGATEQWQVDALDGAINVVASQISPMGVDSTPDPGPSR